MLCVDNDILCGFDKIHQLRSMSGIWTHAGQLRPTDLKSVPFDLTRSIMLCVFCWKHAVLPIGPSHILKYAATGVEPASRAKRALGSCCKFPMVLLDSLLIKRLLNFGHWRHLCLRGLAAISAVRIHYCSLRALIPWPSAHKTDALPTELRERCLRISNIHYSLTLLYEILTPSHLRPQYFYSIRYLVQFFSNAIALLFFTHTYILT